MAAASVRFGKHLKEIRIHLCQKGVSSQGVREFIEKNYVTLKTNNPTFPMLIRECKGVEPKLHARYEFGKEASVDLSNKTSADVMTAVESIANQMRP